MNLDEKLAPNFTLGEFISPRDPKKPDDAALSNLRRLALAFQKLRDAWGRALRINSGWRSDTYNAQIGGAKDSRHKRGDAGDLSEADGLTDEEQIKLAALASQIPEIGAIGLYPGRGFIHVDLRPRVNGKIATWEQRGGKYYPIHPDRWSKLLSAGAKNI